MGTQQNLAKIQLIAENHWYQYKYIQNKLEKDHDYYNYHIT